MVPVLYDKYLHKSNLAAAVSGLFSSSVGILCGFPTLPQRECAIFAVLKSHEQEKRVPLAKGLAQVFWGSEARAWEEMCCEGRTSTSSTFSIAMVHAGGRAEGGASVPQMRSLLPWN